MITREFHRRLEENDFTLGVVGLGYVGLPLTLTAARRGLRVIGFDIDPQKIDALLNGVSYIKHVPSALLPTLVASGQVIPTTDFSRVSECQAVVMCVPTPLNRNREPDMSFIVNTARSVAPHLRSGTLVVLESTTYPGTTDVLLRNELEGHSSLQVGRDLMLAYSPEREDPGNPTYETKTIPKVVGGVDGASTEAAVALYQRVVDQVVPVSSTGVAEMTKLLENIFRSVNIALVNELKIVADHMNIDLWEVIQAASSKPFGFMPFYPGPGLGGHCIPIDPFYLTWKAREYELSTRFIELAGEVNAEMPRYVVQRTAQALNQRKKAINGAKILLLGVAYKRDVDDMRESPALRIIELLNQQGADLSYHDPWVPKLPATRRYRFELSSVQLTPEVLERQDLVMIVTDHSNVDYDMVVAHAPCVIDTRNATRHVTSQRHKIVKA